MTRVGEFYGEASSTHKIQTEYGDYPVEIKYNHWSRQMEDCVTQRFDVPSCKMAQYSLYEWLCEKMAECRALEEEGFSVHETSPDGVVIWSRPADTETLK